MSDLPNLVWLRAFESSARLGSFTAAANELHLTQSAVSHQVRSLEQKLCVTLFTRRSRTLDLTEMGRAWYPSVNKAIEDLSLSTQGLFGTSSNKPIILRIPVSTAVLWLAPRLAIFRQQHPDISIRLVSAIWADAIADEDVDIDIRMGHGHWPGYKAKLLSEESVIPVCAPGLKNKISNIAQLRHYDLIHIHGHQDHWGRLFKAHDLPLKRAQHDISVDTSNMAVELVAAGGGLAMIMTRFTKRLVAEGKIAIPLQCEIPMGQSHYLITPENNQLQGKETALLLEWIEEVFNETDREPAI